MTPPRPRRTRPRRTSPRRTRPARHLLAGLLLVLAFALSGCGGGAPEVSTDGAATAAGPPDAQTATVVAGNNLMFSPQTIRAKVGKLALTMRIDGGVPHNLQFDEPSLGAPIPVIPSGSATQTYTFTEPGTYGFVCTIHSGMVGQVIVS